MDRFAELLVEVDAAFAVTARGLRQWDDPHPDRMPLDEEYSRVLDPAKWRIIGARVDAWAGALVAAGLATFERDVTIDWIDPPGTDLQRTDRLVPTRSGALPIVFARSRIEGLDDTGVTIGAGDPAATVEMIPDCGCDACDSGSDDVLEQIDRSIGGVVRGEFRHLWRRVKRPRQPGWFRYLPAPRTPIDDAPFAETWALPELETITVLEDGRGAHNLTDERSIDAILADPVGWTETTGEPWFDES
ncbi:MAG: DUF6226 family protein [Ilumatobacter fluminis]|uniref:DUF6226 family protein n=1 Tax=Ilumatobacter fluminis TaxID=467091 RepID=UPI0032EBFA68